MKIKMPQLRGLGFGIPSGIITTLGVIVGLDSASHSKLVVLTGILSIALADSFSDALGIHISEESALASKKALWQSSLTTFLTKLIVALSFVLPVIFLSLKTAVVVSAVWGAILLTVFSYYIAKKRNSSPWKAISEHLLIAIIVVIATFYLGKSLSLWPS